MCYATDHFSNFTFDAATNRNTASSYDAEGNTTEDGDALYTTDAAGRTVSINESGNVIGSTFDGAGQLGKRVENSGGATTQTNYYIRSSVLNKVISETDETGKKLKTFVSANGVTLAEQSLVTISGTTSEKLSFIHQDASGASVQQTNAVGALTSGSGTRAGEYDALGRNVADASPFISLNSEPPPSETGGSGVNMSGTSAGYRPGRQIYRIDGQVVSQTEFMETVNSGLIGGAFGLLEMQTRMSAQPPREIGRWERTWTWGTDTSSGDNISTKTNTVTRTIGIVYADNNWQMITSIISFTQQQTRQTKIEPEKAKIFSDSLKEMARRLRKKDCYKALGFKSKADVEKFLAKKGVFNLNAVEPTRIEGSSVEQYTAPVASADSKTGKIYVNAYGNFFAESNGVVSGPKDKKYYLGDVRSFFTDNYAESINSFANDTIFRAFVLLHEIGHLTGSSVDDGLKVSDYQAKQSQNNDNVLKNCFKSTSFTDRAGIRTTIFK